MENKMEYIMAQQNDRKRNLFWTAFMGKREPDLRTRTDLLRKLLSSRCYWL